MIITISRQAATNGELIGRLVAERLHLKFFDRELLEEIAHRLDLDLTIVTRYDEAVLDPVHSLLFEWTSNANEQVYKRCLRLALRRIAAEDNAVVIGRGANFMLRCPECLHVRIIAPFALRVAIYRAAHDVSIREAERRIHEEDAHRAQFVRAMYQGSQTDPINYDLIINLAGLTPDMAAELIIRAANMRFASRLPVEPHVMLPHHIEIMARHRRPIRPATVERERNIS